MNSIILFLISYTVMFLIYLIFFYVRGLKKKTIFNSMQVEYLKIRFNIDPKSLNQKKIGIVITFLDPLIISLTGTIASLPKWNYIIELLLGFLLLMLLIYSFYEILGRIIKKKGD